MLPICFLFSFAAMHICKEWGVRVCGNVVLGSFWCGIAVIFISKYVIAVFRVQAVCGEFKFYVAVVGKKKKSLCRGHLLLFRDKRIQILRSPKVAYVTCVSSYDFTVGDRILRKQSRQIVWLVISVKTLYD